MTYLSFQDFVDIYGLKDESIPSVEFEKTLKDINRPAGIYMR